MAETTTFGAVRMTANVFKNFSDLIQSEYGIKMPMVKKTMLEMRLQKRLRQLGMKSFKEYYDYIFSEKGQQEIIKMIDAVTTNKTDFFREPNHFEFLVNKALPTIIRRRNSGFQKPFKIWSAGCSTGDEPYTLAMVLSEFAEKYQGFQFRIMATDVSLEVLNTAKQGIYKQEKINPIPERFRKKYILRSKDKSKNIFRIVPKLRNLIDFKRLNFMSENFGINQLFDIIFCRNVIIYFSRETQQILLKKFYDHMMYDGYLFLGHSETLNGVNVPLISVAPTVYQKDI